MLVFVYGTLTDPGQADAVLDEWTYRAEAVLCGLHRVDGAYPTLAPGGSVEGRLLETAEVDRLDAYEGVESELYVRVDLPLEGDEQRAGGMASTYVGDPARLDADATWPGGGTTFEERVRAYVREEDVVVRLGPTPRTDRQD